MAQVVMDEQTTVQALASLLDLSRRAREAGSQRELGFLLVNDSNSLLPYRQAALWLAPKTVYALSGLVQVEANAPYVQWLNRVCQHLEATSAGSTRTVTADQLPAELAAPWDEWWPAHALWLGWVDPDLGAGALLLLRDEPWPEQTQHLAQEWVGVWRHAFRALEGAGSGLIKRLSRFLLGTGARRGSRRWWQRPSLLLAAVALAVLAYPVHLTVLAPGELVPSRPVVVRAPLEGVIDVFHVQPNQSVKKNQPLFGFDEALIQSRIQVAAQTLATARTDFRQTSQQALVDARVRPQLAVLAGKMEEKRAELEYLRDQLTRSRVLAPREGVALFDDANEWIGRPVAVGERILRIAEPGDVEVEAWIPIADAIILAPGSAVMLYLNASPLEPVAAKLRYTAHEAVQRPDGSYAYRARAVLEGASGHRVGLKGTVKLQGDKVPLAYWMLRRPIATLRGLLGL